MRIAGVAVALVLMAWCSVVRADEREKCESHSGGEPALCAYEVNKIGLTRDSDDVEFMDFKISVRFQLAADWTTRGLNHISQGLGDNSGLYLGFTGRFGQYIGTRESSPVIAKRFNPSIFFRYWTDRERWADKQPRGFIDFSLGHESNGQSISSAAQLASAQAAAERPEFANDYISRGWDYLGLTWKNVPYDGGSSLATYVSLRYFLENGPLQGRAEEFNSWETDPEGKPRKQVNGVAAALKYTKLTDPAVWGILKDVQAGLGWETGYDSMFKYNTFRFELGTKVFQVPMALWHQVGYNSDLAQYYKKVSSYGIEVQIGSF